MSKKTDITEADKKAFRAAVRGTRRLVSTKVAQLPPKTFKRARRLPIVEGETIEIGFSDYETLPPVSGEELIEYKHPDISHKTLRNLRGGQYNVDAVLDLHGMTVDAAREALQHFLLTCRRQRITHVLMIHGKGHHTDKPTLKNKLNHWLRQTAYVLAFCSANRQDGRGGALYVLLKTQKGRK